MTYIILPGRLDECNLMQACQERSITFILVFQTTERKTNVTTIPTTTMIIQYQVVIIERKHCVLKSNPYWKENCLEYLETLRRLVQWIYFNSTFFIPELDYFMKLHIQVFYVFVICYIYSIIFYRNIYISQRLMYL